MNELFKNYLNDKLALYEKNKHLLKLQKTINKKLKIFFKNNENNFFNYYELEKFIPEIKKFKIKILLGDRNLGKTTSFLNYVWLDYVNKKNSFVWLKNQRNTAETTQNNDAEFFWIEKGYFSNQKKRNISIDKFGKKSVGWYLDIATSAVQKSARFDSVENCVFDEFNDLVDDNKFLKFITLLTTIERLKKNMNVFLLGNYKNEDDDILKRLGYKNSDINENNFCKINISKTLIIVIPKGIFLNFKEIGETSGYALSIAGGFDIYMQQYGGTFYPTKKDCLISYEEIFQKTFLLKFIHNEIEFNLFNCKLNNGNSALVIINQKIDFIENKKIYVFNNENLLKYNNTEKLGKNQIEAILHFLFNNEFFAITKKTLDTFFNGVLSFKKD